MLQNKFGIIFGVANKRSIAWATAQSLHEAGARLAFTYQGDRLKENVEGLTSEAMPGSLLLPCDVTKQEEVDATFKRVGEEFGRLDFLKSPRSPKGRPRTFLKWNVRAFSA